MEKIKQWVKENPDYKIVYDKYDCLQFKTGTVFIQVNDRKCKVDDRFVLSVSTIAAFDRWANSLAVEKFFITEGEVVDYLFNNELDIYKDLIKYLSEEYADMESLYKYEVNRKNETRN